MIQFLLGDVHEQLERQPAETFQLIVADPPYYNVLDHGWDRQWRSADAFLDWSLGWIEKAMRALRKDGLFYLFGQLGKREHVFLHLLSETCKRYAFHDLITWDRVVGYNERRDSFTPASELILVLRKSDRPVFFKGRVREPYDAETIQRYLNDKRYKNRAARLKHLKAGKFATNIWRIPSLKGSSKEKCGHPAQKPVKVIERIVLSSSSENDRVLDPFVGSGTTALVCEMHHRHCVGIENNRNYLKMAAARLERFRKSRTG